MNRKQVIGSDIHKVPIKYSKLTKYCLMIAISLVVVVAVGCNTAENRQSTDTTGVPSALDTMPVLHPGRFDSSGIIKTPPVNDDNVIMPDSAIKNK